MNARQKAKSDMCRVVEHVCDEHPEIIAEIVGFQTAFNKFKILVGQIFETEQFRSMPLNGFTRDKAADRTKLCKFAANIAGFIFAYASASRNETLKAEVNFSHTKFLQMREEQLVATARNVHEIGLANLTALKDYGVTGDKLTGFRTAIDAFNASMVKPRTAKGQKTTMTLNLNEIFAQVDDLLINQMDPLVPVFEESHPDFLKKYRIARKIVDPVSTKTQLKGLVTSKLDGLPVKGVTITLVELSLSTRTNLAGEYLFRPVDEGEFTIRATALGFQDFEKHELRIKLGTINNFNFSL
jgi:hypothetical protein